MKILTAVLLLLTAPGVFGQAPKRHPHRRKMTNDQLQWFYDAYNTRYFSSQLPPANVHFVENLHDDQEDLMGQTTANPWDIKINAEYRDNPSIVLETEEHEMCHIYTVLNNPDAWDAHGDEWQNCMLMLAKAGAFKDLW